MYIWIFYYFYIVYVITIYQIFIVLLTSSPWPGLAVPLVGVNAFATAAPLIDKMVTVRYVAYFCCPLCVKCHSLSQAIVSAHIYLFCICLPIYVTFHFLSKTTYLPKLYLQVCAFIHLACLLSSYSSIFTKSLCPYVTYFTLFKCLICFRCFLFVIL